MSESEMLYAFLAVNVGLSWIAILSLIFEQVQINKKFTAKRKYTKRKSAIHPEVTATPRTPPKKRYRARAISDQEAYDMEKFGDNS